MALKAETGQRRNRGFPTTGRAWADLKAEILAAREGDNPWCHERSFTAAYFAGEDVLRCAHEAYDAYRDENGLFAASAYPSLATRERELIAGVLDLLHAPDGAGGSTTAGGTESILMAMKAARDWAREHRPGSRRTRGRGAENGACRLRQGRGMARHEGRAHGPQRGLACRRGRHG